MSKKGYLEDFERVNEVQIDSPPADRLQKIGCSFVDIHATKLGFMSKDGKSNELSLGTWYQSN